MSMDIGAMLVQFDERLKAVERQSRLSHASLDDAALIVRDGEGSLRGVLGQQGDGTTAVNIVNGGPPPTPATPTVASALGGVAAGWDGTFANDAIIPLDWSRVEVHADPTPGFTPTADTLMATIETARGGIAYIPSTVPLYVCLVARNTSGAASPVSTIAGPYAPRPVAGEIGIGEITATLIADGAVTTPKIFANAITAAKLAVGSVDATALKADAITAKDIVGGTITGTDINGVTVTGSTIQTDTAGQRVVLTPSPPPPIVPRATLLLYTGEADEVGPGILNAGLLNTQVNSVFSSPSVALDDIGARIRSQLTLRAAKPGTLAGGFTLESNSRPDDTDIGTAHVDASTGVDASGPSRVTLFTRDGATTPKETYIQIGSGKTMISGETLQINPVASAVSAVSMNAPTAHTGNLLRFQLNSVDRLTVSNAGGITAAGALAGASLAVTGAATSDTLAVANTTFGTYTPTIAGGGAATFPTRTGWYYKLGKMVYFVAEFIVGTAGTGTANVTITAPSSIHRGARQSFPCHAQALYVSGSVMNGHAISLETGSGAVIDRISVSSDAATNRDGLLIGSNILTQARVSISGWYREA